MSSRPPIIDVDGLTSGSPGALQRVAAQLPDACSEWGLFHVVGHDVPASQLARFEDLMRRFFELPREARMRVRRTRTNARGYYDEELTKNRPDWKQVFDYGEERAQRDDEAAHSDGVNQWPDDSLLPGFRDCMLEHYQACATLGLALLRALSASLGVPADRLDAAFARHTSFVRLNRYPHAPDAAPADAPLFPDDGKLGVHHHTDAGGLTLVYQDEVAGLQVLLDDRAELIEPVPGAFVVNLADMLQVWSNDRYRSPLHRVIVDPKRDRLSAPFFLNPDYRAVCEPISELTIDEPARYRAISWAHFRDQRSAGDYANYGDEIQISQYAIPTNTP
jgi:isopenicillin N synthase-like dioxygenase